jgi:phage replication O-like protein O
MANPQLENGYTRFANELLEATIKKCKGPIAVFFAVARQTYGYQKKSAEIPNEKMCELTGISMKNIHRAINDAVGKNLISILKNEDKTNPTYSINKEYKNWNFLKNEEVSSKMRKSSSKMRKSSSKMRKIILKNEDTPIKENIKKKKENLKKGALKKNRAVLWPKDFHLTEKMRAYAVSKGIDEKKLDDFFQDFQDWAESKGATYKNWEAAFRTRVNKAPEYGKQFMLREDKYEPDPSTWKLGLK